MKRWNKLRRQFGKSGPKVPRGGFQSDRKPEVFALPAALWARGAADLSPF